MQALQWLDADWRISVVNGAYLVAAILFILGLKGLTHPRTAVRGNAMGALGMFIAVVVTLLHQRVVSVELVAAGVLIGAVVGGLLAVRIAMTSMPQLVAVFNGLGGGASALVASAALLEASLGRGEAHALGTQIMVATVAAGLIGAVTLTGSLVAFFKLQGIVVPSGAVTSPILKILNILFFAGALVASVLTVVNAPGLAFYAVLMVAASLLGLTLVVPIGGADMPVVIALLNSYSGLAACGTGFVLDNNVLIISGSLVGASGLILTRIMCKAMNRSLGNVLFGGIGAQGSSSSSATEDEIYAGKVKSTSPDEVAMLFDSARKVAFVPGYGMAVAQAQHAVRELTQWLEGRDTEVYFAIHPVAGRMPGHMNVLLAEADISYDKLYDMDTANPQFVDTDVVVVIGANDVVNPIAREDPTSPIAGMPILDVDKARTVVVVKRSLSSGFAGIPNPLFARDNTLMLFEDGKKAVVGLLTACKELG